MNEQLFAQLKNHALSSGDQNQAQMLEMLHSMSESRQQPEHLSENASINRQLQRAIRSRNKWRHHCKQLAATIRYFSNVLGTCPACFDSQHGCDVCRETPDIIPDEADVPELLRLITPIIENAGLQLVQLPEQTINQKGEI